MNITNPEQFPMARNHDSRGMLYCPTCGGRYFVNQNLLNLLASLKQSKDFKSLAALPRHKVCNVFMEVTEFPPNTPEPLSSDDLARTFFDVQGHRVDAKNATDEQFNAWATSLAVIYGGSGRPWSLEERRQFCDLLLVCGELSMCVEGFVEVQG